MDLTGGEIYQRRAAVLVMIETMQMRIVMMRMSCVMMMMMMIMIMLAATQIYDAGNSEQFSSVI